MLLRLLGQSCPKKSNFGTFLSTRPNFEAFTSTGSDALSFSSLDVIKYLQLSFFSLFPDNFPQNVGKNSAQERRKSTSGWHALLKCLCQSFLLLEYTAAKCLTFKRHFGQFWLRIAIPHWPENRRANGFTRRLHTLFSRRIYWYCSKNTAYLVLWEKYKLVSNIWVWLAWDI